MKKDNLKEFVFAHRDSFDDQQPTSDVLGKIQAKIQSQQVSAPQVKIIKFQYWRVAAILLIGIFCFYVFEQNRKSEGGIAQTKSSKRAIPSMEIHKQDTRSTQLAVAAAESGPKKAVKAIQTRMNVSPAIDPEIKIPENKLMANDWVEALQSESSSTRLSAILDLGKRNALLSDSDLQRLFTTINKDESSNVRLAVLEVLKKHDNQPLVRDFILQSVIKQDDPVIQIELLSSLSPNEALQIKQQLLKLSQDSNHIDLVRDEVYAVLLRSNINIF